MERIKRRILITTTIFSTVVVFFLFAIDYSDLTLRENYLAYIAIVVCTVGYITTLVSKILKSNDKLFGVKVVVAIICPIGLSIQLIRLIFLSDQINDLSSKYIELAIWFLMFIAGIIAIRHRNKSINHSSKLPRS